MNLRVPDDPAAEARKVERYAWFNVQRAMGDLAETQLYDGSGRTNALRRYEYAVKTWGGTLRAIDVVVR